MYDLNGLQRLRPAEPSRRRLIPESPFSLKDLVIIGAMAVGFSSLIALTAIVLIEIVERILGGF